MMRGREVDAMVAAHCEEARRYPMSERKTAAEWHAKLDEIIKHDPDIDSDDAVDLMADLAAVEAEVKELRYKLGLANMSRDMALTGWDQETAKIADVEAERDDLRAYFDFTIGSPELSDDEVKALIARIEAARRKA